MIYDDVYPGVAERLAEKRELIRLCAVSALEYAKHGRGHDPHKLVWAQRIVETFKPLGRPLGTGESTK